MKNQIKNMQLLKLTALVITGLFIASCSKDASTSTGWGFNDPKKGGFEKVVAFSKHLKIASISPN